MKCHNCRVEMKQDRACPGEHSCWYCRFPRYKPFGVLDLIGRLLLVLVFLLTCGFPMLLIVGPREISEYVRIVLGKSRTTTSPKA